MISFVNQGKCSLKMIGSAGERVLGTTILFVVLVACLGAQPDEDREDEQYVVIVSIDGVPAESLWDERIPLPTMRSLAKQGAWANAMVPSTPTKTWTNHTTLATGVHPAKHGVLTNGKFTESDRGSVIYQNDLDRGELSTYPTLYDYAYEAGLRTAGINWPVTRNAETLHDNFPDAPNELAHMTSELRSALIDRGLLEEGSDLSYRHDSPAGADYTWTAAATHLIRARKPDLLLFHLLNVDTMHHRHGAPSWPGFTALSLVDTQLKQVLDALDETGIRDQTTIFVVSDHGFMNVEKTVRPNVLLRKEGLLEVDKERDIKQARVQVVENGGSAMVFVTDRAAERDLETARSLFEGAEGIARVVGPDEYEAYGLPHPSEEEHVGDLMLEAAPGHAFGDSATGEYIVSLDETIGKHGYSSRTPEMSTLFVASGRGVRSGIKLDTVDIRSVAPTAARLLGIEMETADGEVLESILE